MKIQIEARELNLLLLAAQERLAGMVDMKWWRDREDTSTALLRVTLARLAQEHMDEVERQLNEQP